MMMTAARSRMRSAMPPSMRRSTPAARTRGKRSSNRLSNTYGRLDVLVNAAGVPGRRPDTGRAPKIDEQDLEDWNRVMDVNSTGIFLGMKTAIPEMRKAGGGSIINISSIYGLVGSCLLYTSPSPRDKRQSRMPSSA